MMRFLIFSMREAFVQYAEWVLRVATILAVAPPQTFKCTINISDFFVGMDMDTSSR